MKFLLLSTLILFSIAGKAQIVLIQPNGAGSEDEVTVRFDASQGNGELAGASKVYMHHGVVTSSATGTDWNYVKGNWGQDDGIGEMTAVEGEKDIWEITFSPNIREYFNVPANENIYRITAVFRSADGNVKGTITPGTYVWGDVVGGDFFINLNVQEFVTIINPSKPETFINDGDEIVIEAIATSNVSEMSLQIDDGNGYTEVAKITSGKEITYTYTPVNTVKLGIKVIGTINDEIYEEEKFHQIVFITETNEADLPVGVKPGINYNDEDNSKVTLVLEAPGKEYVYVVGDHSDWGVQEKYKMNRTPDGELFWIEIDNLTPLTDYVYQYWIDGEIKVGDPYADQVADPWNDKAIEPEVYSNLPQYQMTDNGIATVFKTGQAAYEWNASENNWQKPDDAHLVIYELFVRDFLESHSYTDLIDTIAYLKNLGVDAIELMPVNEFEGNSSWGYNPNYYFAPDKYYGTKNELKRFIEVAHQNGLAVIMDMVLNHAYGSNAMLQMYWDKENGRPAANNPWFNAEYVGQYQWGYDFNHESEYTQRFIDRINRYWIEEYHFDGYRFDFTKGFTNYAPGGSVDGFDQSRIDILKRMADKIWEYDSSSYVILEHWGTSSEENQLGDYGMKMWLNRSYDFVPAANGSTSGSFTRLDEPNHVVYYNSHDENRIAEHVLTEGLSEGTYHTSDTLVMFERVKQAAAFNFLQPGPKMMWQFDELGYDVNINYLGRLGKKPLPWGENGLGYYENEDRQKIRKTYAEILKLRKAIGPENLANASTHHKNTGATRRLCYDTETIDLVLVGNFGLVPHTIDPNFTSEGTWYNYFTGEELEVSNVNQSINLNPGEWQVYTSEKLSEGHPGLVSVFQSPVSIEPKNFKINDRITITFDATKAWNDGTSGLLNAEKVYMVSGLVKRGVKAKGLDVQVGSSGSEEYGEMTSIGDNKWQITLTPEDYFNASDAFRLGMFFHDGSNGNEGKGFQNDLIYSNFVQSGLMVSIDPPAFEADDEITITFDARQGNGELMNAEKVYIHSGVSTVKSNNPASVAWNHVVGNWGQDDGLGEMTQVEQYIWQLTLVPKTYYKLGANDHPFWMACVFRSADGNTKGTAPAGDFEFGFTNSGGDNFIENQSKTALKTLSSLELRVYPNPSNGIVHVSAREGVFELYTVYGQQIFSVNIREASPIDISHLKKGLYIYKLKAGNNSETGRLTKY